MDEAMLKLSNLNEPKSVTTTSAPEAPRKAIAFQSCRVFRKVSCPSGNSPMTSNGRVVWIMPRTNITVDKASPRYAVAYRTSTPIMPKRSAASTMNSNPVISCPAVSRSALIRGSRSCLASMATCPDALPISSLCGQDSSILSPRTREGNYV